MFWSIFLKIVQLVLFAGQVNFVGKSDSGFYSLKTDALISLTCYWNTLIRCRYFSFWDNLTAVRIKDFQKAGFFFRKKLTRRYSIFLLVFFFCSLIKYSFLKTGNVGWEKNEYMGSLYVIFSALL